MAQHQPRHASANPPTVLKLARPAQPVRHVNRNGNAAKEMSADDNTLVPVIYQGRHRRPKRLRESEGPAQGGEPGLRAA